MQLDKFLSKLNRGKKVSFDETLITIENNYIYHPTRFTNGIGADKVINDAGNNEGSCKIFAFAKLHRISKDAALALFGDYYWKDVLENPQGRDHANIRNFIKYGWKGVEFSGEALIPRK